MFNFFMHLFFIHYFFYFFCFLSLRLLISVFLYIRAVYGWFAFVLILISLLISLKISYKKIYTNIHKKDTFQLRIRFRIVDCELRTRVMKCHVFEILCLFIPVTYGRFYRPITLGGAYQMFSLFTHSLPLNFVKIKIIFEDGIVAWKRPQNLTLLNNIELKSILVKQKIEKNCFQN